MSHPASTAIPASPVTPSAATRSPGRRAPRRGASIAIAALAWLMTAGLVAQVFLVGLALFVDPARWMTHRGLGMGFAPLALVVLVLALVGRQPSAVRWRAAALLGLMIVQIATAAIRGIAGTVHPVNAILIFWLTLSLMRHARAARDAAA